MNCPKCGYQIDRLEAYPWGDGKHVLTVAPLICAGCGEAMILNLVTNELHQVPPEGWAVVKAHNPELWKEISSAQETVRSLRAAEKAKVN